MRHMVVAATAVVERSAEELMLVTQLVVAIGIVAAAFAVVGLWAAHVKGGGQ